ncbi:hypothetical protein ILUMI_01805 [Ignelater luminosus]|uniref:Uncharacterized protein n=1 Tax=Ignelater luminosus TaxID=2038154 RepID=A0A8K0GJV5_IGNLU|nr:hypothetical protein ILUMI_01805 [Ignelater luminosus]
MGRSISVQAWLQTPGRRRKGDVPYVVLIHPTSVSIHGVGGCNDDVVWTTLGPARVSGEKSCVRRAHRRFRSNEEVFPKRRRKKAFTFSEEREVDVLAYFEGNRENSIRDLSRETGLCLGTIHTILKKHQFVPYKYKLTQCLTLGDHGRRMEFCQWFLNASRNNPTVWRLISWSDEANFSNSVLMFGVV